MANIFVINLRGSQNKGENNNTIPRYFKLLLFLHCI